MKDEFVEIHDILRASGPARASYSVGSLLLIKAVVDQSHDLDNKSMGDRKETRYPREGGEYVPSKTSHAEKHSAGDQDDPCSQLNPATSAGSRKLLAGRRLHGRQDIPTT
jgi:hypothetical protein